MEKTITTPMPDHLFSASRIYLNDTVGVEQVHLLLDVSLTPEIKTFGGLDPEVKAGGGKKTLAHR